MKLGKRVYYCQCWHLADHESPLFDEPIEAWREGPVVPALYKRHRGDYGVRTWPLGRSCNLNAEERSSVEWVVANYGGFSAVQLSRMTHNELPWKVARGALPESARSNEPVSLEVIRDYYSRQRADAETAVTLAIASAALEGAELDAEWQDRLRDVATGAITADELIAQEIERLKSV